MNGLSRSLSESQKTRATLQEAKSHNARKARQTWLFVSRILIIMAIIAGIKIKTNYT